MVLGKLPVPGRPTIWIIVGQGPTALAVGAGGGCLDIFTLIYPFSPLSPSLWETARYRLKYCLKGPLNPKLPTNYSQGRVKHDMRIAKKTRYKRVQNALISIAFLRFANALTNAPIKWLHKNAKIAFVRVFRFSQSELRFHFAFLRANAFAI